MSKCLKMSRPNITHEIVTPFSRIQKCWKFSNFHLFFTQYRKQHLNFYISEIWKFSMVERLAISFLPNGRKKGAQSFISPETAFKMPKKIGKMMEFRKNTKSIKNYKKVNHKIFKWYFLCNRKVLKKQF